MTTIAESGSIQSSYEGFLRLALRLDAVASGAAAIMMAAGGSLIDSLLGIPAVVLHSVGAFLLAYAVGLAVLSSRRTLNLTAVVAVIVVNIVWVLDSVAVLMLGLWPVTTWGTCMIAGMAVVVAGFAVLQYLGLRRAR